MKCELHKQVAFSVFFLILIVIIVFLLSLPTYSYGQEFLPWTDINQDGWVQKYEAQKYTIYLKDHFALTRGINVGEAIGNYPNTFSTEEPGGQETFMILNGRIRLLKIQTPNEFPKNDKESESYALALNNFFRVNWPEFTNPWKMDQASSKDLLAVFASNRTKIDKDLYEVKIYVGIDKTNKKIVELETFITIKIDINP